MSEKESLEEKPVLRVVIACDEEHAHAGCLKPRHACEEVEPGEVVPQIAVEDVARKHHKPAPLLDGERDQPVEGRAGGAFDAICEILRFAPEPEQRAVQVQVGCMQELEGRHRSLRVSSAAPRH